MLQSGNILLSVYNEAKASVRKVEQKIAKRKGHIQTLENRISHMQRGDKRNTLHVLVAAHSKDVEEMQSKLHSLRAFAKEANPLREYNIQAIKPSAHGLDGYYTNNLPLKDLAGVIPSSKPTHKEEVDSSPSVGDIAAKVLSAAGSIFGFGPPKVAASIESRIAEASAAFVESRIIGPDNARSVWHVDENEDIYD